MRDNTRFNIRTNMNRFNGETNTESAKYSGPLHELTARDRVQIV